MKTFRRTLSLFAIGYCLLAISLTGCGHKTLEAGGAYAPAITNVDGTLTATAAPDYALLALDSSYDLAYETALTACRFEQRNRVLLRQLSPGIKKQMDQVRAEVWKLDGQWAVARKAYLAQPVAANLDPIRRILAEMQRWNAVATSLIPQENTP